jgi:hypothetical protein
MRGSRSSRSDPGFDQGALNTTVAPVHPVPLVRVAHVLLEDSEAGGACRLTSSDLRPSDRTEVAVDNSLSSLGEAVLVVRLARTQRGVDVVVEVLSAGFGWFDALREPDARPTRGGDRDDELSPYTDSEKLVDYMPSTSGHATRRQPHHDRSHTDRPRRVRQRRRTAAILAAGVVLIGLVLLSSPSPPDIPASSVAASTPPVTATPSAYEAQWFAAVGPNSASNLCGAGPSATLDWLALPGALESCVQNQ